ncbi:hypothetical protein ACFQ4O_12085, partial [Methylopila musalis]
MSGPKVAVGLALLLAVAFCAVGLVLIKTTPTLPPLATFGVLVGVYTILALALLDVDAPSEPAAPAQPPARRR